MDTLKEISQKLYHNNCFYRCSKSIFIKILGEETVNQLIQKGYLKDSPKIEGINDYIDQPCLEFSKKFKLIFNYHLCSFWEWIKYYIILDTIEDIKKKFK